MLGLTLLPALAFGQASYIPYTFTTLAGSTSLGSADGTGPAAAFAGPVGAAVDTAGFVYVADTGTSTIRKISPAGSVTTFAGRAGVIDIVDGTGDAARFANPTGPSSAGSASSGGRIRIVVCRLPDPAGRGPRVFPLFLTRASCFAGPP